MAIVEQIVTNAIYRSLQDRQFQPVVNGGYLTVGNFLLNTLLDQWRDKIPFASSITFNNIANLTSTTFVEIDAINYILNTTSTPLMMVTLRKFQELQSIIGLKGFPLICYFDQLTGTISVYPSPSNTVYQFTVWGRVSNINLGLFDQIPSNMPPFMQEAITWELAIKLSAEFGVPMSDEKKLEAQKALDILKNLQEIDLTAPTDIAFSSPTISDRAPFPYYYYLSGGSY